MTTNPQIKTSPVAKGRRRSSDARLRRWAAALLGLGLMLNATGALAQDHGGDRGGGFRGGPGERGGERAGIPRAHLDGRFQHNQYYPGRGAVVGEVPHGAVTVDLHGDHYFYGGGVWYRPYGGRFVVVGPPFGVFVPILPPYYTTLWWGGVPYYYANDTYYVYSGPDQGYQVVAPPADPAQLSTAAPPSAEVYLYPKNGQSPEQQSKDKYECHRWAVSQTGFDPTQPGGAAVPGQGPGSRAEYQRAMNACLVGRGYGVG
jgi:hypothetical protein